MKSEQLYIIAIVVVLLVILFIYNVMNGTPPTINQGPDPGKNQKPVTPTIPTCSATVQILYIPSTPTASGTITMSVASGTKTVSSSFTFSYTSNSGIYNGDVTYAPATITGINFDQVASPPTYLNFWLSANPGGSSDHVFIASPSSCPNFSVSDSQSSSSFIYDSSAVTVTKNVVTFVTSSNTLTLTFPTNFS